MVLADSHGVSTVLLGIPQTHSRFRLRDCNSLWCKIQLLRLAILMLSMRSHNPSRHAHWFRLFPVRSPLLRESNFFLFLRLLRCFSSPGWLVPVYGFNGSCVGLPHSETSGSMLASNSPERIVGNDVLLRLCVPRYPPWALISLTTNKFIGVCDEVT